MNIAHRIIEQAKKTPNKDAIRFPQKSGKTYSYESLTFEKFEHRSNHFAACLREEGIKRGDKVLLFVKQSLDFPTITFSLFKMGAIPVLIDPGMGKSNLLSAIKQVRPDAIIAEPIVFIMKLIYPSYFKSIKTSISTKSLPLLAPKSLAGFKALQSKTPKEFECVKMEGHEKAAILFTSGGTGIPKGVVYTHDIFNKQTETLRDMFHLNSSQIDIPGFPLFSFFTMAMGMTSCIPDMDPSKPAKCDPSSIVQNIIDNKATFVAGSPAIWSRVGKYCIDNNIKLPTVNYVVMFGAPVRNEVHEMWQEILPSGTTYTPYGATECLPVANIDGKTVLKSTAEMSNKGLGTCIGKPAPNIEVKIIESHDNAISEIKNATFLNNNEVGEIITCGPFVTPEYYEMPEKTSLAKIRDGEKLWHRMGDLGRIDENGNIWFYGRKSHLVKTENEALYSIASESVFNLHPQISKTALIDGPKGPSLVIEENNEIKNYQELRKDLSQIASNNNHTRKIKSFYIQKKFPVDVRHNIKIDRMKLSSLAKQGKIKEL